MSLCQHCVPSVDNIKAQYYAVFVASELPQKQTPPTPYFLASRPGGDSPISGAITKSQNPYSITGTVL